MVLCTNDKVNKVHPSEMEDKLKNTRIQEIFQTMEYGENFENLEEAFAWIKTKGDIFAYVGDAPNGTPVEIKNCVNEEKLCTLYVPELDTIKKVISKNKSKTKWIDTRAFERTKLLNKLAQEIEKNADVLAQLEIVSRGILGKDTKDKAVPLLAQYFYYYSSFAVKYNQKCPNWKPEGIVIGVISNENALSNLGLILAPALAAGYHIVLQVGTRLSIAAAYIFELANKVGISEDVLRLIPSDDGELLPYLSSENVAVLTLFVDLHNEKYLGINNYNKKILNLSSYKTSVIVFDDADLDSACTNVIDAAWGYQGLLPWSANTILVQENIFDVFLNKLKRNLRLAKIGLGNDRMVDISYSTQNLFSKSKELIKIAKLQGIDVFQVDEQINAFTPTLFIGGKAQTNRVISADEYQDVNVVTVLAFRSIDEAINLANNTRQGLAASVWSDNIGVVNEVASKLKVSNVWINGHGLTTPELTLSPTKDSGVGYFGGKEGFYEYVQVKTSEPYTVSDLTPKLNNTVANAINSAKKAQVNWCRVSKINKSKLFQQFADFIDSSKNILSANLNGNWLENWITCIYDCITDINYQNSQNSSIMQFGFSATSSRIPRGVVAIEANQELDSHNHKLILSALFEGNAVILLNDCKNADYFYKELSKKLPNGVLNVFPYSLDNLKTATVHKELNAYFGGAGNPVFSLLPVKDSKIFTSVGNSWSEIYRKVTVAKNIWSNVGKSSTCDLSTY